MRLVTYDRRGHRRLGAFLGGEVVDLPDLVGHPAFPATMDALVSSRRGAVLDAARAALERDEAARFVVSDAVLLPPLLPSSLRSEDAWDGERRMVGHEAEVLWPAEAGWLDYRPKVAAVLGGPARRLTADEAKQSVFGYMLVNDWVARDANGDPTGAAADVPLAIGPCIVTADDVDPQTMFVRALVDGEEWAKGNLNGTARNLAASISRWSRMEPIGAADTFAESPFEGLGAEPAPQLWPGAVVELEAEGIGTLRNVLGPRP